VYSWPRNRYNRPMEARRPGWFRRMVRRVKYLSLALLFLLVPFAGAFHPKLRRRQDPDEKEIGGKV
jgi:hypothetical protein